MNFLIALIVCVVFVFLFKGLIKKYPVAFYAIAIGIDALFIYAFYGPLPPMISSALFLLIQKCTLSLALFTIVMYIGVFAKESKVKTWLLPIRAELSIIAWILSLGHMAIYLMSYVPRIAGDPLRLDGNILGSFIVAIILFVLLLILGVTSFNVVKKQMKTQTWKRVQMLAYPFFILVYAHLLLMLLPAALRGGQAAQISVAVYSVVFVGYAVLRIYRAVKDRSLTRTSVASQPGNATL